MTPSTDPLTLPHLLARQQAAFRSSPPPTAGQRRSYLRCLEKLLQANQGQIVAAVQADFGQRSRMETLLGEILTVLAACRYSRRSLEHWMRPQRRPVGMVFQPALNWVEYQPLGVVGVIAPWNYPVLLTLGPLVDILAAGNHCLIKPSELTPHTNELLDKLLGEIFPPDHVGVVPGGVEVARAFCALPFDHLLFTGSTARGREVMHCAATNLVPVTLELGGKSPVILAEDFSVAQAARSVGAGKFFNAGQSCVSPDYALVPTDRAPEFTQDVLRTAERMFPSWEGNPDYTAIISSTHYTRLQELVAEAEQAGAQVLQHRQPKSTSGRQFPPTVVLNPPTTCRLMQEEVFGPVLPVVGTSSVAQALAFVGARPRPLALYLYTHSQATRRQVLQGTTSGGVALNSTMVQVSQVALPFGGVGPSGMGAYHGRAGFERFSHPRAIHQSGPVKGFEILQPPHGRLSRWALRWLTGFSPVSSHHLGSSGAESGRQNTPRGSGE